MNEFTDYKNDPPPKSAKDYGFMSVQEQVDAAGQINKAASAALASLATMQPGAPLAAVPLPLPSSSIDLTLAERGKRYGVFAQHAVITQSLKSIVASELGVRGKFLAHDQQEAMDMICHKMGRIINGDPDYVDSWIDIAGYAQLVADRLTKDSRGARA